MNFSTHCPACGASLPLDSKTSHTTCPFCGRDFDVDLSESAPQLRAGAGKPKEYDPPLESERPEIIPPTLPDAVIPPVPQPIPTTSKQTSYARFEPPAEVTAKIKKASTSLGKWLWVLIILLVLMCVSCVALGVLGLSWVTQG